jgi:hypothetical protein
MMSTEVQLKPGWLMDDVRKASERLTEWAKPRGNRQQAESANDRAGSSGGRERSVLRDVKKKPHLS